MVNRKVLSASLAAGVIGLTGAAGVAMAATDTSSTTYPPIVQKIADKFHLKPADVQQVFKDDRAAHEKEMQTKLNDKLEQAVKDGKLTEDQKTKLIAELDKLHTERQADRQADRAERRADRQDFKTTLDQWAKDNGITNLSDILPTPAGHPGNFGGPVPMPN
jgi:hypothetical protein